MMNEAIHPITSSCVCTMRERCEREVREYPSKTERQRRVAPATLESSFGVRLYVCVCVEWAITD